MLLQPLLHIGIQRSKAAQQHLFLGLEMVVKSPCGDSCLPADVAYRYLVKLIAAQEFHCRAQDGLLRPFGLLPPPLAIIHGRSLLFS